MIKHEGNILLKFDIGDKVRMRHHVRVYTIKAIRILITEDKISTRYVVRCGEREMLISEGLLEIVKND